MRKYLGYLTILLGAIIFLYVLYANSPYSQVTRPFSPYTLLTSSWERYKTSFIKADGRVVDYSQNGITTSEGQSYALLRAVWLDDKPEFDLVWNWTRNNLQLSNGLFGWRWGQIAPNRYGFLPGGGNNSASDADTDIALALIFAADRWGDKTYLVQAQRILPGIWNEEVATVAGQPVLTAGNWAKGSSLVIVNPSYFAPYAWRIFAKVDQAHSWNNLLAPAYNLLDRVGNDSLGGKTAVGLPPDWVAVNMADGALSVPPTASLSTDYAFNAMRVPWRIALDYEWNKDSRAYQYLQNHFNFLAQTYSQTGKILGTYHHDGTPATTYESPAMYATILPYFQLFHPNLGQKIYNGKIIQLYSTDRNSFNRNLPYYDQNWLWFGAAIYNHYLRPL